MEYAEFIKRIDHNTETLKKALDNGDNLLTIADKLYTWEHCPGELHFSVLMRNLHDIIPCAFLGALANTKTNGVDGYIVKENGTVEYLEVKTSEIASSRVWKGARGGLNIGTGTKKTQQQALTSALSAKYKCLSYTNLKSKNLRTILFIADTDNIMGDNKYIDAWEMHGKTVLKYLRLSDNVSRSIKFGSFQLQGFKTKTVVPLVGFDKFKSKLEKTASTRDVWLDKAS
jgi:hypothetical protein